TPGEFLVVYASGRDEVDPAGYYHTNFSMSAGGEFLALVDPEGEIVSQFGSEDEDYPAQASNQSFGVAFDTVATVVVDQSTPAKYFIPIDNTVDASWMLAGFDDT